MDETTVPLGSLVLNRDMLSRFDGPLCEWDPLTKRPAMLSDPYHAPSGPSPPTCASAPRALSA